MHKISLSSRALQVNFPESSVRWDKAHRWVRRRLSPILHETYLCILEAGRDVLCDRHLANLRGVSDRTIRNHKTQLRKAGVLRTVSPRVGPKRNAPTRYILLDMDGRDRKISYPEKRCREIPPRKDLRATTAPQAARGRPLGRVEPSKTRLEWEARRSQDTLASKVMREVYVLRAQLWDELKRLRGWKAEKESDLRVIMSVGRNTWKPGDPEPEQDPNVAEFLARCLAKPENQGIKNEW